MKKSFVAVMIAALAIGFSACGGGGGGSDENQPTVTNATTSGDYTLSGTLRSEGGALKLFLNSIVDPATGNPITDASASNFAIDEAAAAAAALSSDKAVLDALAKGLLTGKAAVTPTAFAYGGLKANIFFVFDTTGSMSEEIDGVKNSIQTFANTIAGSGIDAKFGIISYGDAYDTLSTEYSSFTVGTGSNVPPDFDYVERPYLALTDPTTLETYLNETIADGGGDWPENGYGAVAFADSMVPSTGEDRADAVNIFIVITDAAVHTPETYTDAGITGIWIPPALADLKASLGGLVAVNVVTLTGCDADPSNCAAGEDATHPNARTLATETGGSFVELPIDGNVDLVALDIQSKVTGASVLTWDPTATEGTVTITVTFTYGGKTGTLVLTVLWP